MHHDFFRVGEHDKGGFQLPPAPSDYEWSDDIWATVRGEWAALYHPLNLGVMYLRRQAVEPPNHLWRKNRQYDLFSGLISEMFLFPRGDKTDSMERQRLIDIARSGKFRFICILPTTDCSLNCAYCHQRPAGGKGLTMTRDEIIQGMKKCATLCADTAKPVDILLYGGEPLEAFHITEEILKLTSGKNRLFHQQVRLSFTTSGAGLTGEKADTLARHNFFVIISIDGPPQQNDSVRRTSGGNGSFSIAEEAYFRLKERGCRVGLSVTMGKHNLEDFSGNVEFLLDRFHPNDIGLNAFLHRRGDRVNPYQVDSESAFTAFIEGFDLTRKYGVYAEQPFRRLKPFVYRKPLLKDCSSPGERLVLAPGGVIGFCDSCYPDRRYFYRIEDFPGEEHRDYSLWAGLSSPEMRQCRGCPAMTVCGGACRYDAFTASGRLDGTDPERCRFELAFLRWMIWELFDQANIPGNARYYIPQDEERMKLFGNVSPGVNNQPFTAGSYSVSSVLPPPRRWKQ